jgi:hypothetical protein
MSPHPPAYTPTPCLQESEECAALVANSQLVLVEGADHNFTQHEAGEAMARHVVDFVLEL